MIQISAYSLITNLHITFFCIHAAFHFSMPTSTCKSPMKAVRCFTFFSATQLSTFFHAYDHKSDYQHNCIPTSSIQWWPERSNDCGCNRVFVLYKETKLFRALKFEYICVHRMFGAKKTPQNWTMPTLFCLNIKLPVLVKKKFQILSIPYLNLWPRKTKIPTCFLFSWICIIQ